MAVNESLEVPDEIRAGGEFTDVKAGQYKGNLVAVKTRKISSESNSDWIRQVGGTCISSRRGRPKRFVPGVLQTGHPLEQTVSSQHLEAARRSWGHGPGATHHRFRMDGRWPYHRIHQA